jgi:hypothetical protein
MSLKTIRLCIYQLVNTQRKVLRESFSSSMDSRVYREILSKLFIVSILGTREHMAKPFIFFGGRASGSVSPSRPAPRLVQAGLQITDRGGLLVAFLASRFRENG